MALKIHTQTSQPPTQQQGLAQMSTNVLIIGESGSGKSASLRNVDGATTQLIMTHGKPLPFKGWQSKFNETNTLITDNAQVIVAKLRDISDTKPDIKLVVIDDFQYIMAKEFFRRRAEVGYQKFTDIGGNAWDVFQTSACLRPDLIVVFFSHTEESDIGTTQMKTLGKMLREKGSPEGLFTICIEAKVIDGAHKFLVKNNGHNVVKAPMGMFTEENYDNDLAAITDIIRRY